MCLMFISLSLIFVEFFLSYLKMFPQAQAQAHATLISLNSFCHKDSHAKEYFFLSNMLRNMDAAKIKAREFFYFFTWSFYTAWNAILFLIQI